MTLFCPGCRKSKPESAFYKQSGRQTRMQVCKECHKARVSARRIKRRAEMSEEGTDTMNEKAIVETVAPASGRRLVSIREACIYGKFSRAKCYELINAKRIKAYKFDTRTLVDLDTLDALFASLPEM